VRAIEIEIAGAKDTLATKHDVLALHQASDVTRAELRAEMKALAAELRAEMKQLSASCAGRSAALRARCTWPYWARRPCCWASSTFLSQRCADRCKDEFADPKSQTAPSSAPPCLGRSSRSRSISPRSSGT
jgi:hypothetical protein